MPSTSKIVRIQVNSAENEEIIASWLNESDESSADENDYIQSDRVVDSEDEYCDDEEATACDLDSASSEDDIPLSILPGELTAMLAFVARATRLMKVIERNVAENTITGKNAA
ncbi:hypothetical protein EVAR_100467_1 [Eumeta japonica]|uniref:Uncharacterized protein n=1 Tax=Eumeta variegata TaxID=151549 RepID=A0A4C2A6L2_EUMVA|nr:hypothetical protein EVAR_100467_1 [Eumeta japonica]